MRIVLIVRPPTSSKTPGQSAPVGKYDDELHNTSLIAINGTSSFGSVPFQGYLILGV